MALLLRAIFFIVILRFLDIGARAILVDAVRRPSLPASPPCSLACRRWAWARDPSILTGLSLVSGPSVVSSTSVFAWVDFSSGFVCGSDGSSVCRSSLSLGEVAVVNG